jgi:hypothetical protein
MKTNKPTISPELQAMISHCQQRELQCFCERINLACFPASLQLFVDLVGIDTTLKISLITRRLRIPKWASTWQRLGHKPAYALLLALPPSSQEKILQHYHGCCLEMPRFTTIWNRALRRASN